MAINLIRPFCENIGVSYFDNLTLEATGRVTWSSKTGQPS